MFIILSVNCYSQQKDSSLTYIEFSLNNLSTTGPILKNISPTVEIGKQWDVFSLGFVIGTIQGNPFIEARPNLNVFQQGKFTNTLTPGIGIRYNSVQPILMEFTSGIEYSYSKSIHYNINFGQWFFNGKNQSSNSVFIGFSFTKFFLKK